MSGPRTFRLTPPLSDEDVFQLTAGDKVLFSGTLYTARDAAHKRLVQLLNEGRELPFPPQGAIIYYVGPTPPPPGRPVGAAGPTTAYRMDPYTPRMLAAGVKASPELLDAIQCSFASLVDLVSEDLRDIWQRLDNAGIK